MTARAWWWIVPFLTACGEEADALPAAAAPVRLTSACTESPDGTLWRFHAVVPDPEVRRVQVEVSRGGSSERFDLYPDPVEPHAWSSEWRATAGCPDVTGLATFHGWRAGTPVPLGEVEVVAGAR